METARISTILRLRPDILERSKMQARRNNQSFNAYVEALLEKDTRLVFPRLPDGFQPSEEILGVNGCLQMPAPETLDSDPRLAHILRYATEDIL